MADVYGEPETIEHGNVIATVYSPILTDEERARRMTKIKNAAADIVLASHLKKSTHIMR